MTVRYQRIASPPPSLHKPPPGPSHQRTGSSPATLQNVSPSSSPGGCTQTVTTTPQGAQAIRTNCRPHVPILHHQRHRRKVLEWVLQHAQIIVLKTPIPIKTSYLFERAFFN
ncbi:hypothetical protein SK128_002772, partial [Halocaridina rubra]